MSLLSPLETKPLIINILKVNIIMKKYLFGLVLLFVMGQTVSAQDLNKFMADLAKMENVERQVINREMLNASLENAKAADKSGGMDKRTAFMTKIDSIEVVALEDYKPEIKAKVYENINSFKDGNGYETLITVKDEEDYVRIIAKRNGDIVSEVFIIAIDDEDIAIVKMAGNLSQSDLEDIVNEQKRNNKK